MAEESISPRLNFGQFVAFVAPGAIVLAALGRRVPAVMELLRATYTGQFGIGAFLLVVLASLTIGLVISGIRDLGSTVILGILRPARLRWGKRPGAEQPFEWARMTDEHVKRVLLFHEHFYRFYQFHSSTAIACVMAVALVQGGRCPLLPWWGALLVLLTAVLLLLAGADMYLIYRRAVHGVLDTAAPAGSTGKTPANGSTSPRGDDLQT